MIRKSPLLIDWLLNYFTSLSKPGKCPRKRPRSRLCVEELERRDCPNTAPVIGSLNFDPNPPMTNDLLTVEVIYAFDEDGDTITFQYDWFVNGQPVQTTTTMNLSDNLDLSQPGFGNQGDTISVTVIPRDPFTSGDPVTELVVVDNNAPVLGPVEDMYFVEGEEVYIVQTAYDPDGDQLTFSAENLPGGLTIDPYTGIISGTVDAHSGPEDTQTFPVRIIVTDGIAEDEASPFCQVVNFNITSVVITPPPNWNGTVVESTTFTVTISGVGRPNNNQIGWTVYDDDPWPNPDDIPQSRRTATPTYGANNTWTVTRTFELRRNTAGNVAGDDGQTGEAEAEIYVYVDAWSGHPRAARWVERSSAILTVTAGE